MLSIEALWKLGTIFINLNFELSSEHILVWAAF